VTAVAALAYCHAEETKLRPEDRKVLQDISRFHEVHSTTNLPPAVIKLCAGEGGMAEPGQNWQAGCVGDGKFMKRLIWGATSGDYYIVHYESGGIVHSYHLVLATCKQNGANATIVWHRVGKPFKNHKALVDAIDRGEFDD
jgi:hypothetical protein